ncbi:MAG: CD225/dispanin family protein, partial [Angustibacter sp.]
MSENYPPYYNRGPESRQPPPGGAPPPNYLVAAILSTFFCCLIPGIISIIYATQVNRQYMLGDTYGALDASASAKTWAITSIVLGI